MAAWRIRDAETVELVNKIAALTGQAPAEVVAELVRDKLEQLCAEEEKAFWRGG